MRNMLCTAALIFPVACLQAHAGTTTISSNILTNGVHSVNFVVTQSGSYTFNTSFSSPGAAYTFVGDLSTTPNSFITGASGSSAPLSFTTYLNVANSLGYYFQIANFGATKDFSTTVSSLNGGFLKGIGFIPQVSAVPEPETYAMLLAGLGLAGFMARRRRQNGMGRRAQAT